MTRLAAPCKVKAMTRIQLLTTKQVAKSFGYTPKTIVQMANDGRLKGQKIGDGITSAWVFKPNEVEKTRKQIEGNK